MLVRNGRFGDRIFARFLVVSLIVIAALTGMFAAQGRPAYADEADGVISVSYFLDGEQVYGDDIVPAGLADGWQLLGLPPSPEGYAVFGWYLKPDPNENDEQYTKLALTGPTNVYAVTVPCQYNIKYDLGAYGGAAFENGEGNPDTYSAADVADHPIVLNPPQTQNGFTFKGWAEGGEAIPQDAKGPMTFTAMWVKIVSPYQIINITGDTVVTVTSNGKSGENIRFDVSVYNPNNPNPDNVATGEYIYTGLIPFDAGGAQASGTFDGYLSLGDNELLQISIKGNKFFGEGSFEFAVVAGKTFTVTFYDSDGAVIGTPQTIEEGDDAIPPQYPAKDGYRFLGWDSAFTNVHEDLDICPICEPVYHAVTFVDFDGAVLNRQYIAHGANAETPTPPIRDGYTFAGWDRAFSNVTENLTVTALYNINKATAATTSPTTPTAPTAPGTKPEQEPGQGTAQTNGGAGSGPSQGSSSSSGRGAAASGSGSETVPLKSATSQENTSPAQATTIPPEQTQAAAPYTNTAILPEQVPLASPGTWALSDLVFTLATGFIALALIVVYFVRRREEQIEYTQDTNKHLELRLVTVALAAFSIIMFAVTESVGKMVALTGQRTPLFAIVLAAAVVIAFVVRKGYEGEEASISNP